MVTQKYRDWWSLPPALYSNRAQAYLKVGKWENAVKDCSFAIAKSIGIIKIEAEKFMEKSVYRRAEAHMKLNQFSLALNDWAYLCRNGGKLYSASSKYHHFKQVLDRHIVHFKILISK
eukprot:m.30112 g.30112  ORF g.30112 m.30112 type:complete len:118 (+) comp31292_c0_seq15:1852-2205(+)